jgi:ornithine cyclodeaminase
MKKLYSHFRTKIIAVECPNEAVAHADIITVVTYSKTPVFDGTLVKRGALINGVGSYTPLMQEIDEIQDIITADAIYKKAKTLGIGTKINF